MQQRNRGCDGSKVISMGTIFLMVLAVFVALRYSEGALLEEDAIAYEFHDGEATVENIAPISPISIEVAQVYAGSTPRVSLSRGVVVRGDSVMMTVTGYCACEECCGKWAEYGRTASGLMPVAGRTVANGSLPFGTMLYIDGHVYTVEDRGVGEDCVDIYFDTHEDALQFGRQVIEVLILSE